MENTCIKCGETKNISLFSKDKRIKKGISNICKICTNIYYKKYSEINRERLRENHKKFISKNPEANKIYKKKYRVIQSDAERDYLKKSIETLKDFYIKRALKAKGFEKEQITTELIEVQRIIIKTKRLCKTSKI
jgi:uncharacterized Zn finger protein (UPF0148 family)